MRRCTSVLESFRVGLAAATLRAVGHQHLQLRHLEFGLLLQPPLFGQGRRQLEHFHRVERFLQ
jgi:hypothetical protein